MKSLTNSRILLLVLVLAIFLTPFQLYGQNTKKSKVEEKIVIYAIEIPGLHQKDGKGAYDIILNSLEGMKFEINLPPKRALHAFKTSKNSCFSPSNLNPNFYDWAEDIKQTDPLGEASIHIFSPQGKPVINQLSELKNKTVGIRMGMPYGKTFDQMKLNTKAVRSIELNIKKLDKGRIDYMVAYIPDAYDAFKNLNKDAYPHDKESPVAIHYDRLVCKGLSSDFIKAFNKALQKYKASKKIK